MCRLQEHQFSVASDQPELSTLSHLHFTLGGTNSKIQFKNAQVTIRLKEVLKIVHVAVVII